MNNSLKYIMITIGYIVLIPVFLSAQNTGEWISEEGEVKGTKEVINDDLIVKEAVGIGDDMDPYYNFGFNTFVIKDKQIKWLFNDNSLETHPGSDWKISINDDDSGGASYFRIWDVTQNYSTTGLLFNINAGAPDNTLFIQQNTGFVGLGTDAPLANLHIHDITEPTIRLNQDGQYYDAYQWDIGGNETQFFIKEVSNSGTIPISIEAGTPENTMVINANSQVGIGTDQPEHKLEVKGTMQVNNSLTIKAADAYNDWKIYVSGNNLIFDKGYDQKFIIKR